jgi:DNA-directed RNA polymerase subunit RPC12/RpoP
MMAQESRSNANGPEGMLTLVCLTCGNELFFTTTLPRDHEACPRCGSMVFRSFFTPTVGDDATESMLEDTARATELESAPPEPPTGDVRDVNNP